MGLLYRAAVQQIPDLPLASHLLPQCALPRPRCALRAALAPPHDFSCRVVDATGEREQHMGSVSQWANDTFGELARELADIIPSCLLRAHHRARDGHEAVRTKTLEAYGNGLYAAQYEELAQGLAPYGEPLHLRGRAVMLVKGRLLYPLCYAKRDAPVTSTRLRSSYGLRAELIRELGPEPMQQELDLGLGDPNESRTLPELLKRPGVDGLVLLPYACSMEQGVIRAEWGTAELPQGRRDLLWHHHDPLLPSRSQTET